MYPNVIFVLFFFPIFKYAYTYDTFSYCAKWFFYLLGLMIIGNLYILSALLQNAFLDGYFYARSNYYGG